MENIHGLPSDQTELLGVVRGIRNRYRAKLALRGAAITIAASWLLVALTAYAMNALKYSDAAVLAGRIVDIVAIIALTVWFVVLPLLPSLADEQVALYLEEHEPSLNASVITAVEHSRGASVAEGLRSPAIIARLTRAALDRVHRANDGRAVDAGELRTNAGIFAAVTAAVLL